VLDRGTGPCASPEPQPPLSAEPRVLRQSGRGRARHRLMLAALCPESVRGSGGCPGQVLDDAAILHYVGISHDDNRHRTSAGLKHLAVPATSGQKGALQTQIVILEKWRRPPPR
jgi:hypothetical protein